jgi:hypothetical protein
LNVCVRERGREEDIRERSKLHNEELHYWHASPHSVKVAGLRMAYKILVGKIQVKRSLERPRCEWKSNIKVCLGDISVNVWSRFKGFRTVPYGGPLYTR